MDGPREERGSIAAGNVAAAYTRGSKEGRKEGAERASINASNLRGQDDRQTDRTGGGGLQSILREAA